MIIIRMQVFVNRLCCRLDSCTKPIIFDQNDKSTIVECILMNAKRQGIGQPLRNPFIELLRDHFSHDRESCCWKVMNLCVVIFLHWFSDAQWHRVTTIDKTLYLNLPPSQLKRQQRSRSNFMGQIHWTTHFNNALHFSYIRYRTIKCLNNQMINSGFCN